MFRPVLLAALLSGATLPAAAETPLTEAEREAFRAEVRAYLLENPEVLMEAIGVLEARQAAAATEADRALVATHAAALFAGPADWVGGNPQGDITVVEFMDYRCGYCRKAFDELAALVESDGNIRLVIKEFPILGPDSEISSRFAIATLQVAGPAAYEAVHDALITLRGTPTPEALARLAGDLGLDAGAILSQLNAPAVTAVIETNRSLADTLQISGTPTFVIGETMLRGYAPLDAMQAIVAEARTGG
jgi:protein-disulfide isomerase